MEIVFFALAFVAVLVVVSAVGCVVWMALTLAFGALALLVVAAAAAGFALMEALAWCVRALKRCAALLWCAIAPY